MKRLGGVVKKGRVIAFIYLAILSISLLISCNHGNNDEKKRDIEKPKDVPYLNLTKLLIYNIPVVDGKIILENDEITAGNIDAYFTCDSLKKEERIEVVVKDSPFVLDKTKPKILYISVPEKENIYKAWRGKVEVSWQKGKEMSNDLITKASLKGSSENGIDFFASKEQIEKLLKNEGLVLEMKGPRALLLIGSNKITWTKCVIDGQDVPFGPYPALGFKSVVFVSLDLSTVGSTTEHRVLVETAEKKQELSFNIKRLEGTVDIPYLKLFIVGRDVITDENLPKLFDGSKPKFKGTDPCNIEIQCANDDVSSCRIDGSADINMKKKTIASNEIYFAEHSITGVSPSGKDVTVVIKPKNTSDYHEVRWQFHLEYQAKIPMSVIYTFNNKARRQLDQQFVQDLEEGKKPTLVLNNASFLNMKLDAKAKLSEVKINDTSFTGDKLLDKGIGTIFNNSFPITVDEQDIKIVLIPKDVGKYAEKVFEFKVKGDGNKEKLNPSLSINDKTDFSDEFMTQLTDNSEPIHKVFKTQANIEILVDEYTYTFLTNSIKVNEEEILINAEKHGFKTLYIAKKSIDVTETEATNVKIEFVPKIDGMFDALSWKFKVQAGAEKPVFPKDKISIFTINGIGGFGEPLPKELLEHLTDGNPYTYIIDKNEAIIEVGWYGEINEMLKHAIFELDGVATTVVAQRRTNAFICSYKVELPDQAEHDIKIKMIPKEDVDYKELVYNFKIKKSGLLPKLPLKFWVENLPILDGGQKDIETDMPIISVVSEEDEEIMNEVAINGVKVDIEKKKAKNGNGFFFEAIRAVDVSATDYTDIIISATPKDVAKYRVTTCVLKLKAKAPMPKNNGKFAFSGNNPRIIYNIEWVDAKEREADNDHGAKSVIITFYTESPHAKVKYKSIFAGQDKDGKNIFEGDLNSYEDAKHIGNMHITEKIQLDQDKPVTIKAEVHPDEGVTDTDKGIHYFTFNPVILLWNYSEGANHNAYTNIVRDLEDVSGKKVAVIKVDKTQIQEGKLYLALSTWKEEYGCIVDDKNAVKFTRLEQDGDIQWYKATIDVSSLNSQSDEVEVSFPLLFKKSPSFTYKFKIKLQ